MDDRRRYDEKLQRILKEASAIFADKSYHQASIRDISAATGISLSGLYYYFKSKEELLFLIQSHCFDTILDRLREDLAETEEPEKQLRILIGNHLEFFAENMAEMKVLSHEGDTLRGEYGQHVLEQKKAYAGIVQSILAGISPWRTADDLRVATFSLFGMMNWIYTWYRPDRDVSVERLAQDMSHTFLRGLAVPVPPEPPGSRKARDRKASIWRDPPS